MLDVVFPVLFVLFVWWFSTGVILYLDGLPRWTFKWTFTGATALLVFAFVGLAATRNDTRMTGAYLAFTAAVMVWAWQEVAFLLGYITGPRRGALPAGSARWQRVGHAVQAVLYHELALLVLGAIVLALTYDGRNLTGLWTYMVLWVMRQSAKLNIFLGVRNLNEGFLPSHLSYLQTYFRRAPMNGLFPVSVVSASVVAFWVWNAALAASATPFQAVSGTLIATLLTLAVLEHWFLVLPLPSEQLWNWGLRSRDSAA